MIQSFFIDLSRTFVHQDIEYISSSPNLSFISTTWHSNESGLASSLTHPMKTIISMITVTFHVIIIIIVLNTTDANNVEVEKVTPSECDIPQVTNLMLPSNCDGCTTLQSITSFLLVMKQHYDKGITNFNETSVSPCGYFFCFFRRYFILFIQMFRKVNLISKKPMKWFNPKKWFANKKLDLTFMRFHDTLLRFKISFNFTKNYRITSPSHTNENKKWNEQIREFYHHVVAVRHEF